MKLYITYIKAALVVSFILYLTGCERRPLEDEIDLDNRAIIPVTIYWDLAQITPQNVTILAYDETGALYSEKAFENSGSSASTELLLKAGKYTIVVFNEKRDQIDYVHIRGYEKLSTLEAYATKATSTYQSQSKADGGTFVNQPGDLATAQAVITVDDDLVSFSREKKKNSELKTSEVIEKAYATLLDLHPVLKTSRINMKIHVSGLNNTRLPVLGELMNVAGGYHFATDKNSTDPVGMQFLSSDRSYNTGSLFDGILTGSVNSFGLLGDRQTMPDSPIYLNVMFQLVDEKRTLITLSKNVSNGLTIKVKENKAVLLEIDSSQGLLPTVKPEGGSDSGFDPDLVDWESVIIPIHI